MIHPVMLLTGCLLFLTGCSKKPPTEPTTTEAGISAVFDSVNSSVSAERLDKMLWQDIEPTLSSCVQNGLIDEVLKASTTTTSAPCRYLRGLLYVAKNDSPQALDEWQQIDLKQLPADFLYAPWRLSMTTGGTNRYEPTLARAVAERKVNPLITARWQASKAEYVQALESYLKTNPEQWSSYDVELFKVMRLHNPVTMDVRRIIAGALSANKVPEPLRKDLAMLIKEAPEPNEERFKELLESNPEFAQAAVEAVKRDLAMRQAFASNRFDEVTRIAKPMKPSDASDATILMAFLSHMKTGDLAAAKRWSDELLKRHPGTETEAWISQIQQNEH